MFQHNTDYPYGIHAIRFAYEAATEISSCVTKIIIKKALEK